MTFTSQQIMEMDKPYQTLGNGDALAEHRAEIDELTIDNKRLLATRLISGCPSEDLTAFRAEMNALKSHSDDPSAFHTVITQAFEVKKRLIALLDPKNKHPHNLFLESELNEEHFHHFNKLALTVLEVSDSNIALRLALTTPASSRSKVASKIAHVFPNSPFATKVAAAFMLRTNIDHLLLGDTPAAFFTSRDFNDKLCLQYGELFELIDDHEASIVEKLAKTTSAENRDTVLANMRKVFSSSALLKRAEEAFASCLKLEQLSKAASSAGHPDSLFKTPSGTPESVSTLQETLGM